MELIFGLCFRMQKDKHLCTYAFVAYHVSQWLPLIYTNPRASLHLRTVFRIRELQPVVRGHPGSKQGGMAMLAVRQPYQRIGHPLPKLLNMALNPDKYICHTIPQRPMV